MWLQAWRAGSAEVREACGPGAALLCEPHTQTFRFSLKRLLAVIRGPGKEVQRSWLTPRTSCWCWALAVLA